MLMTNLQAIWILTILFIAGSFLSLLVFFLLKSLKLIPKSNNNSFDAGKTGVTTCLLIAFPVISFYFANHLYMKRIENISMCEDVSITLEGKSVKDVTALIRPLNNLSQTKKSGSRPTQSYRLELHCKSESITLTLKQDSRDPELFWVYPDLLFHGGLGYARIEVFDNYFDP